MIPIKTDEQIEKMREAGRVAATVLDRLAQEVKPGVTTYDLDQLGKQLIEEMDAVSACHNYRAGSKLFPAYTCISVNEEIIHGIGTMKRVIREGDIVSLDVSVVKEGFIGDNARTVTVEPVSEEVAFLVETTQEALAKGVKQARAGKRVGDISNAIQRFIEGKGLSIVKEFVGHGVGKTMHEEPQIPNYGKPGSGPKLLAGMTLAIEPMVNLGKPGIRYASDGWTAVTADGLPSAHFEHTVLITKGNPEILTLLKK